MAYSYTPTYYSSLHDSITSFCKNVLPFSFKKRRIPAIAAAEQLRAKQQSDNLKWQQESFHQIHNLMGLCKEGIRHEDEVSAYRAHLLETLIASPFDYEPPVILRDKLIFLQELLYAKCISEDEYHASKRPLLQRLAVQGAEIGERDVIVCGPQSKNISNEGWSAIDFKEEKCSISSESLLTSKNETKEDSTSKRIKGTSSILAFVSPKSKEEKDATDSGNKNTGPKDRTLRNELLSSSENPFWSGCLGEKERESKSILMMESLPEKPVVAEKAKRKPFMALFQREEKKEEHDDQVLDNKEKVKVKKTSWGFDGFKKWKKHNSEDETAPLSSLSEKSDTKTEKKKPRTNGSPAILVDKAFGENMKKELDATSLNVNSLSCYDDNADCVVNMVEKDNSKRWIAFEDEENSHPNFKSFSRNARASFNSSSIDKGFKYNPFFDM